MNEKLKVFLATNLVALLVLIAFGLATWIFVERDRRLSAASATADDNRARIDMLEYRLELLESKR